MKRVYSLLFVLTAVSMVQAAETVNIDFGRYDSQTDGYYNIHTGETFSNTNAQANYVNNATSATTQHDLSIAEQSISLTYTHTTDQGYFAGKGLAPTMTKEEEDGWKNAIQTLPDGYTLESLKDGLTTQKADGTGSHTLIFTGLAAGTYTLSGFGG